MEPNAQLGEMDMTRNSSSFLKGTTKMADIHTNPFGEHDKPNEGTSKHLDECEMIPINLGGVIGDQTGSSWEPISETSFRGKTQKSRLMESQIEGLHKRLSEVMCQDTRAIHLHYFKLQGNNLYFRDKEEPLMCEDRKLRATAQITRIFDNGTTGHCTE